MTQLRHFLLVFDHQRGHLLQSTEFADSAAAIKAYSRTERQYEGNKQMEIVLIGADSFETVKRTHANYFNRAVASKYLQDL
jgi:hypothetical protein